jgi:hypothetical protein
MTKEKFNAYRKVQFSGATNMWNVQKVIDLSDDALTREDCLDIMQNYKAYAEQFGEFVEDLPYLQ